jgi:hypothetical protein
VRISDSVHACVPDSVSKLHLFCGGSGALLLIGRKERCTGGAVWNARLGPNVFEHWSIRYFMCASCRWLDTVKNMYSVSHSINFSAP